MTIEDGSNDRKYFSLVPHYILNHSSAIDQALYMQMKRYAGENPDGVCWASKTTLRKRLKVGVKAVNKSIQYLIDHKWISNKGKREVITKGGKQEVEVYAINDIWKVNIDFYESSQGIPESAPLEVEGIPESNAKVFPKGIQGIPESASNKNTENKNHMNKIATQSVAGINEVIKLFEGVNPTYETIFKNKTQRAALERLVSKFGVEKITNLLNELPSIIVKKYAPRITTPLELERDLGKLVAFVRQEKNQRREIINI